MAHGRCAGRCAMSISASAASDFLVRIDFDQPAKAVLQSYDILRIGFEEPSACELRIFHPGKPMQSWQWYAEGEPVDAVGKIEIGIDRIAECAIPFDLIGAKPKAARCSFTSSCSRTSRAATGRRAKGTSSSRGRRRSSSRSCGMCNAACVSLARLRRMSRASRRAKPQAAEEYPMPELRKDPIVGRWVIIAPDRAKRPIAVKNEPSPTGGAFCPFCEGSEENTPFEILAYRDRTTKPNERGLARPRGAEQVPRPANRRRPQQARRRHLRQDERHRRP